MLQLVAIELWLLVFSAAVTFQADMANLLANCCLYVQKLKATAKYRLRSAPVWGEITFLGSTWLQSVFVIQKV